MAFWRTLKSESLVWIHSRSSHHFVSLLLPASFRAVDLPPAFQSSLLLLPYLRSPTELYRYVTKVPIVWVLGSTPNIHPVDTHSSACRIPSIQSLLKPILMFQLWTSSCDLDLSCEASPLSFRTLAGEGCPGSCTSFLGYWRPFVDVRAWAFATRRSTRPIDSD